MIELLNDGNVKSYHYFELSKKGEIIDDYSEFNIHNDCTVCIIKYNNKKITIIGLVLFDRINYIHSIFKDDISYDYNDVINQFIDDDIFNKIKDNYTKFPTFVYKMYCLNYAVKLYPNYHTTIIDLYYATKLVFFSCFNNCFKGNIDKKNITELTDNQINVAKEVLKHYLDNDFVFTVHVNNSNQDWLNLDNLNKLDPDNYKTSTGDIKIPNFVLDKRYKVKDVISKFLEEIRDEISHLYATHNNFKNMMINDIIKNESIPKTDSISDTIDTIKQVIGENTGKLVCIPVVCMTRHTSYLNYKLMESVIDNINKKRKKEAGVEDDIP
jgi:transcription termination factor NusB